MANYADPDQLASSEANRSGSTLFAKQGISGFSRTRVKMSLLNTDTMLISLILNGLIWYFSEQKRHIRLLKQHKRRMLDSKRHLVWESTMLMAAHLTPTGRRRRKQLRHWPWHRKNTGTIITLNI